ncbi:hypothetical protein JYU14_01730 [Simkania negevensis]|uniref:DUF2059 domain-containing protein n=1 Tax=Simkania negevensis TaxID=83561 RepID=A0ABS3AR43_9BACT|nr:hypothetical protein [Simkania negevensis]
MKIITVIAVFLFLFTNILYAGGPRSKSPDSPYIKLLDKDINKISREMKREYNIELYGSGGALMTHVKEVSLSFMGNQILGVDEARELFVKSMQKCLSIINDDEQLRPYLETYPMTERQIALYLSFIGPNNQMITEPNVSSALNVNGKILYSTDEPGEVRLKRLHSETYEHAEQLVLNSHQLFPLKSFPEKNSPPTSQTLSRTKPHILQKILDFPKRLRENFQ